MPRVEHSRLLTSHRPTANLRDTSYCLSPRGEVIVNPLFGAKLLEALWFSEGSEEVLPRNPNVCDYLFGHSTFTSSPGIAFRRLSPKPESCRAFFRQSGLSWLAFPYGAS